MPRLHRSRADDNFGVIARQGYIDSGGGALSARAIGGQKHRMLAEFREARPIDGDCRAPHFAGVGQNAGEFHWVGSNHQKSHYAAGKRTECRPAPWNHSTAWRSA